MNREPLDDLLRARSQIARLRIVRERRSLARSPAADPGRREIREQLAAGRAPACRAWTHERSRTVRYGPRRSSAVRIDTSLIRNS
jgi:hypothetical protein